MRSSIFSSKSDPIWAAMGVGLVLIVGYELLIKARVVKEGEGVSQQQVNTVHLEDLAFRHGTPTTVLVGSSMTNRLRVALVDSNGVNASQSGDSSLVGLEVIRSTNKLPKVTVVELGRTLRQHGSTSKAILDPFTQWIAGHFDFLQQRFNFVNVGLTVVKKKVFGTRGSVNTVSDSVRKAATDRLFAEANSPFSAEEMTSLRESNEKVLEDVEWLKTHGSVVILHVMPVEPSIETTAQFKEANDLATQYFPKNKFLWFEAPKTVPWHTNDGMHLTTSSANDYARALGSFCNLHREDSPIKN